MKKADIRVGDIFSLVHLETNSGDEYEVCAVSPMVKIRNSQSGELSLMDDQLAYLKPIELENQHFIKMGWIPAISSCSEPDFTLFIQGGTMTANKHSKGYQIRMPDGCMNEICSLHELVRIMFELNHKYLGQ